MIIRHPVSTGFTVIQNRTLTDDRLSWKARGLLAYLLTKPDGWRVIVRHLTGAAPDGKAAVLTALQELEACGYLVRRGMTRSSRSGKFDGFDTEIYERPVTGWPDEEGFPQERGTVIRFPVSGLSVSGKSDTSKDSIQENTELRKPRSEVFPVVENPEVEVELLLPDDVPAAVADIRTRLTERKAL